jgi:hypothetical protein
MAYVPGFTWDIFLSYPMEAQAWAQRFKEDLQDGTELAAEAVPNLKIYFGKEDWRLGENSDEMLEAARGSAVFVAVLTRDSLAGDAVRFMQREMEAFRTSSPLRGRFCPIPLYPITGPTLAQAMPIDGADAFWNSKIKFYFHEDDIPLRLTPIKEPEPGQYIKAVEKAAHELRELLEKIRAEIRTDTKGTFAGRTVLLAPTAPNSIAKDDWISIRNLLANDGATILPNETVTFEAAVQKAELFVQIFTAADGLDEARAQLESVAANRSIAILQWRKKFTNAKMDAACLEALDEVDRKFCEGEYVRTGLFEDFKIAVRETLAKTGTDLNKRNDGQKGFGEKPFLYIVADTVDLGLARQIQDFARPRTVPVVMDEDETRRRDDFAESIKLASGVIFLHGHANRQFISRWLAEFAKKTCLWGIHPKIRALYQAPPTKGAEDLPLVPMEELRREGSQTEFTLDGIDRICAELCGGRA